MAPGINSSARTAAVPVIPEHDIGHDQQLPSISEGISSEVLSKIDVVRKSKLDQEPELDQGSRLNQEPENVPESALVQPSELDQTSTPAQPSEPVQTSRLAQQSETAQQSTPDTPPTYIIDLSLPPAERYVEVASDFKDILANLSAVVEDLFEQSDFSAFHNPAKWLAKLFLRRVHSDEQTEELRGISQAAGVEMYLLVAFNALIDMCIGCTSGGMKANDGNKRSMFHFRTLDLPMPVLRRLIVQFEYVQKLRGKVVARSIGYVGLVGILTGVRPGLSLSLNSRNRFKQSGSIRRNFKYYGSQLAILFRLRPSIASRLREYILPKEGKLLPTLAELNSEFPSITTTSCYVVACDGDITTVFEKDVSTAHIISDTAFIIVTNHDQSCESGNVDVKPSAIVPAERVSQIANTSINRKQVLENRWRRNSLSCKEDCATIEDLQAWMVMYPTANNETQFAAIMDPKEGEIAWCRRWTEPLVNRRIRVHR
ncbi:hypothetical protein EG328_005868 [Venturia inaequalis]|uniref:ceramidase n=1 Tax=Venturia inaequalis TaxID=5025 RepID=A0A8H3Z557_VENIN|nr:hypothetical protein EG328_005868 [Venturia inaequalis]